MSLGPMSIQNFLLTSIVPEASEQDANAAVAAAKAAFPAWSALEPAKRGGYLKKLATLILQHNEELAVMEAQTMGKPVSSYIDAFAAVENYEHYAEACKYSPASVCMLRQSSDGLVSRTTLFAPDADPEIYQGAICKEPRASIPQVT